MTDTSCASGLGPLAATAAACGGDPSGGEGPCLPPVPDPVGEQVLPDLAPAPPTEFNTRNEEGKAVLRFRSILANVGEGEFHLRASRESGEWTVQQLITYSEAGGELREVPAEPVWGGDGHHDWHIAPGGPLLDRGPRRRRQSGGERQEPLRLEGRLLLLRSSSGSRSWSRGTCLRCPRLRTREPPEHFHGDVARLE